MKKTIDIITDICSGLLLLVVETIYLLLLYCGGLTVPRRLRLHLSLLLLVFGTLGLQGQEIFNKSERQPFDAQPAAAQSGQLLKAPGNPGIPPPGEDDKVGGAPMGDILWLWPFLAVGYGVVIRRKKHYAPKSPEGDSV